jgi:hypothetical protein
MTPEISLYAEMAIDIRAALDKLHEITNRYAECQEEYDKAFLEWQSLNEAFTKALTDCFPPIIRASLFEGSARPIHGAVIDYFVRFPLLVMEFDGDEQAASTAWARGQRPTQWMNGGTGDHDNQAKP